MFKFDLQRHAGGGAADAIAKAAVAAAQTAATAVTTTVVDDIVASASSDGKSLIQKGKDEIARLIAEIGTTDDIFVKIRNAGEVIVLTGLVAGAAAGLTAAISELAEKINK